MTHCVLGRQAVWRARRSGGWGFSTFARRIWNSVSVLDVSPFQYRHYTVIIRQQWPRGEGSNTGSTCRPNRCPPRLPLVNVSEFCCCFRLHCHVTGSIFPPIISDLFCNINVSDAFIVLRMKFSCSIVDMGWRSSNRCLCCGSKFRQT